MPTPVYLALQQIQQGPGVRAVLDRVADRIAGRVSSITTRDHLSRETNVVTRTDGVRPQGRAYARIGINNRTRAQAQSELAQANTGSGGGSTSLVSQAVSGARNPRP